MSADSVFIYGSLKRGFRHHAQLAGARFVAAARTQPGRALALVGEYPALVPERDAAGVAGELYSVPAVVLARLDVFEDCPTLYQRQRVELVGGESAWAYVMGPGAGTLLGSGEWTLEHEAALRR